MEEIKGTEIMASSSGSDLTIVASKATVRQTVGGTAIKITPEMTIRLQ